MSKRNGQSARLKRAFSRIVEEIKELKITYTSGLTAPNGAVAGTFNAEIT